MLTYAAGRGHTFFDRRLYLLAVRGQDAPRRRDARVPEEITFATKPELGTAMLHGAITRGLPFAWVAADADYGKEPALRTFLHEQALPYVRGIPVTLPVDGPPGKPHQPAVAKALYEPWICAFVHPIHTSPHTTVRSARRLPRLVRRTVSRGPLGVTGPQDR